MTPFVLFADGQPPIVIDIDGPGVRIAVGDVHATIGLADARQIANQVARRATLRPIDGGAA